MEQKTIDALTETRYSVHEAAGVLNMSDRWVRVQIQSGLLKAERYGRVWRVRASELRRFIEESAR